LDALPAVDGFSEDVLADNGAVEIGEVAFLGVDQWWQQQRIR